MNTKIYEVWRRSQGSLSLFNVGKVKKKYQDKNNCIDFYLNFHGNFSENLKKGLYIAQDRVLALAMINWCLDITLYLDKDNRKQISV